MTNDSLSQLALFASLYLHQSEELRILKYNLANLATFARSFG
ncbi:hypothetical protein [Nostoc sp. CHAB 5836]|nr:hypothetical protein [Nostoc sp. CHAB 5836]